jgi:hypothetical protein
MICKTCGSNDYQPIEGYPYCKMCTDIQRNKARVTLARHNDMLGYVLQDGEAGSSNQRARSRTGAKQIQL